MAARVAAPADALAAPRVQRHRGGAAHQPRPRAAVRGGAGARSPRWPRGYSNLEYDVRAAASRQPPRPRRRIWPVASPAPRTRWWSTTTPPPCCSASRRWPQGREVIVSRGELIEIGGSFRLPDVMAASGAQPARGGHHQPHPPARLRAGHRRARPRCCSRSTAATSRWWASPSEVAPEELVALGRERGVPTMFDLGSGSLVDSAAAGPAARS